MVYEGEPGCNEIAFIPHMADVTIWDESRPVYYKLFTEGMLNSPPFHTRSCWLLLQKPAASYIQVKE